MSLQFVIDGNNIMHHPGYIKFINNSHKDSRLALLEFIRFNGLCGSGKNNITVVFDGYPRLGASSLNNLEINIVFSGIGTADEEIKKICENSKSIKTIVVVSDDNEIKYFVKSMGARTLGVKEFVGEKKTLCKPKNETLDVKMTYSQMCKVNEELKKIWLREKKGE